MLYKKKQKQKKHELVARKRELSFLTFSSFDYTAENISPVSFASKAY